MAKPVTNRPESEENGMTKLRNNVNITYYLRVVSKKDYSTSEVY